MSFFSELKRRNVFRVAVAYVVVAWLVLQVADVVLGNIGSPGWVFSTLMLLLGIGFPVVVVFSWAYEITPEGLKREHNVDREDSITHETGRKLDLITIAVVVLAVGFFAFERFVLSERAAPTVESPVSAAVPAEISPQTASSPGPKSTSVAVLPFVNMSDDKEQEYFSEGLSEELLNLLAKIPQLQVAARTSSFALKDKEMQISEIGELLKVANVLEGSVRKSGDRVRITAQLIKADDGYHLWSETYDRTLEDVFAIQDEIAGHVVDALKVKLLGEAPHPIETDPETYTLFLQARHYSNQLSREGAVRARDLLERVVAADPDYIPALDELSRVFMNMSVFGVLEFNEAVRLAGEAAERAIALDPSNADALVRMGSLATMESWNPGPALDYFRRSLEIDPNNPRALGNVALLLLDLGELELAARMMERAVQVDPVNPSGYRNLGMIYINQHRPDDAVASLTTSLSLSPEQYQLRYFLGWARLQRGEAAAALADFELEEDEEYRVKGRALAYFEMGRQAEFEAAFTELKEKWGEAWPSEIAHVYAWIGEVDAAFEWMDRAVEQGEEGLQATRTIPLMIRLHDDPRWQPLLERIGVSDAQIAALDLDLPLSE